MEKEEDIYRVYNNTGTLAGYIFTAEGRGYQGPIKIICGISVSLDRLLGIEILESTETPGLGAKIDSKDFKNQFKGLAVMPQITYTKSPPADENQIQAITGATVSSRSVVNILNSKIEQIRDKLK